MPNVSIQSALAKLKFETPITEIHEAHPDVIFAASYSTKSAEELAAATRENFASAIALKKANFPKAWLAYGNCSHPYPQAELDENRLKMKMLVKAEATSGSINIGPITSSVTEMIALREALRIKGIAPRAILVCTCELHSRAEKVLAEMVFPGVKIVVWCNSYKLEVEPDHPTPDQCSWDTWIACSVKRYKAFKFVSHFPGFIQSLFLYLLSHIKHKSKE